MGGEEENILHFGQSGNRKSSHLKVPHPNSTHLPCLSGRYVFVMYKRKDSICMIFENVVSALLTVTQKLDKI